MAHFSYAALDKSGSTRKGRMEAQSRQALINRLLAEGLTPYEIRISDTHEATASREPFWKRPIRLTTRLSKASVAGITRQLATLLQAGMPLDRALAAINSQDQSYPAARVVGSLHEGIINGKDLAQELANFPGIFSRTFIAMVHAGETSGTLELVMERLASHLEREVELRRKVRSALAYPVLMLVVGFFVVIFLLSFVIPQVTQIFADMNRALPLPTRMLLAISDGFRSGWPIILGFIGLLALLIWRVLSTEKGRRFLQKRLFSLPLAGPIYAQTQLGNFARTLGMLLKNGVPLLKGLQIVKAASGNLSVTESVQEMIDGVQSGRELSAFMTFAPLYPPIARQMVAAGEKSGQLAEMLLWVANDADNNVASRLQTLTALLEPVMILVLGALVGFVVIAIILPIFEMSSLAG